MDIHLSESGGLDDGGSGACSNRGCDSREGSTTFLAEEAEGEGGEGGFAWPHVLQMEGPASLSKGRPE